MLIYNRARDVMLSLKHCLWLCCQHKSGLVKTTQTIMNLLSILVQWLRYLSLNMCVFTWLD